jgi:hypothetical protein
MNLYQEICKAKKTAKCQTIKSQHIDVGLPDLADAFATIEKHNLRVEKIVVNAVTYSIFRKFGRDVLDIVTQASDLHRGLMAYLWGAQIFVTKYVPERTVYIVSEKNHAITTLVYSKETINNQVQKMMLETEKISSNLRASLNAISLIQQHFRQCGLEYEKKAKGNYTKLTKKGRTK